MPRLMPSSKSFLPPKGSPEAAKLIEQYLAADIDTLDTLASHYGYANRHSFGDSMRSRLGIKRETKSIPPLLEITQTNGIPPIPVNEIPIINLPPVELKKYTPINSGRIGDPETQVLHLTDWHDNQITPSFNHDVLMKQIGRAHV